MYKMIHKAWNRFLDSLAWATHINAKLARDKPMKREKEIELVRSRFRNWRFMG